MQTFVFVHFEDTKTVSFCFFIFPLQRSCMEHSNVVK